MTSERISERPLYRMRLKQQEKLSRDTWIATHSPISAEKLHALGYINFVWNGCERDLFSLFCSVSNISTRDAWILVHDLGDIAICTRIRELARNRYSSDIVTELLENIIIVYDECRKNRNQLSHFTITAGGKLELSLYRLSKKPDSMSAQPFADDLWDLRRVGRDINRLRVRLRQCWVYFDLLRFRKPSDPLPSLPKKLAVPKPLWTPPPPTPKVSKRRPRPTDPSLRSTD